MIDVPVIMTQEDVNLPIEHAKQLLQANKFEPGKAMGQACMSYAVVCLNLGVSEDNAVQFFQKAYRSSLWVAEHAKKEPLIVHE